MKKIIFAFLLVAAMSATAKSSPVANTFSGDPLPEVNQKILKSFTETFIYAEDVVWQETNQQFQANFWQGGINIRACYDDQGNLLQTIRYYFEKQLPPTVLSKLKRKYAGKAIFGVTEISSEEAINYFVTLQDDKNWYTVKSDVFGNLQQTDKFKKAE